MAGAAQGDRARREARGGPAKSSYTGRAWRIRREASVGPVTGGGGAPDQRAGCEIERAITAFARPANGGLIVAGIVAQRVRRDVIIKLAARYRLPAVYTGRVLSPMAV